jgi:hypothetical protein
MANRKPKAAVAGNGSAADKTGFSKEAYEYVDDVTISAVQSLQKKVGVDFSSEKWRTLDAFGRVLNA